MSEYGERDDDVFRPNKISLGTVETIKRGDEIFIEGSTIGGVLMSTRFEHSSGYSNWYPCLYQLLCKFLQKWENKKWIQKTAKTLSDREQKILCLFWHTLFYLLCYILFIARQSIYLCLASFRWKQILSNTMKERVQLYQSFILRIFIY